MTPAIDLLTKNNIKHSIHEYAHDDSAESFGREASQKLNVDAARVFKTLVAELDGKELVVGIVPVDRQLHLKSLAKVLGAKKAKMADIKQVQRSTGYVLGGVSPIGQKKRLATVIDASANEFPTVFVSAGRRGLEIELTPADLSDLTQASFANLADA